MGIFVFNRMLGPLPETAFILNTTTMKRFYLLFLLAVLAPFVARAQTELSMSELVNAVKAPYSELDSTKIATGYLIDQAVDLVKVGLYDGQELQDSNYVNISSFCDLLRTMNYAKVNNVATVYNADSIYESMTSSSYVKLSSALFEYNRIREDAISGNLISYDINADRLHDLSINGIWQNPYETDYVFMFTSSRPIVDDTTVTFDISDLTSYYNSTVSSIMIDLGDGCGYTTPNTTPVFQVSYLTSTQKELKLKVTLQNNTVLESHTYISFRTQLASTSGTTNNADDTLTFRYGSIKALCSVKYAPTHNGEARKPLIYVEGFDHPVMCELGKIRKSSIDTVWANILFDNCSHCCPLKVVDVVKS